MCTCMCVRVCMRMCVRVCVCVCTCAVQLKHNVEKEDIWNETNYYKKLYKLPVHFYCILFRVGSVSVR